ncbi:MAG TPA: carboxylesterase family protein [Thermoleophilaceae bacterium]
MRPTFAITLSLLGILLAVAPGGAGAQVAQTAGGTLQGVHDGAADEWRGVPYARPPVGALRWRSPQPVQSWSGTRSATQFAPECAQPGFDDQGQVSDAEGSEDCLYLNVFAPRTASPSSRLPVMVHLHGGSNSFLAPYRDADAFVRRGVIVVTVAYRLGIFGFVGHPALSAENGGTSGEYGLLDQIAALRWVHDNIAAFGGDPGRVTLFGFSAGSFDTAALMVSPLTRGLIHRAAVQGVYWYGLTGIGNDMAEAESLGSFISAATPCDGAADVAACLRALSPDTLIRAANSSVGFLDLQPWTGGVVLPKPPLELMADAPPRIPLLIGTDREEDVTGMGLAEVDEISNTEWVRRSNEVVGRNLGSEARSLYPPASYDDSRKWALVALQTDAGRACPTRRLARATVPSAPVFRYLDTHRYQNDPFLGSLRAAHVLEDPFLWGNFNLFPGFVDGYEPTAGERALSARMTDYWVNFARTGDPNGGSLPAWPRYDTDRERTLLLDETSGLVERYHVHECAFMDALPFIFP